MDLKPIYKWIISPQWDLAEHYLEIPSLQIYEMLRLVLHHQPQIFHSFPKSVVEFSQQNTLPR